MAVGTLGSQSEEDWMILSMTGFGEARAQVEGVTYRVEIRSLNNRYFKLSCKLPEQFQRYEPQIDKQLRSKLGRGSVHYILRVRDENTAALEINKAALSRYVAQLQEVAGAGGTSRIDLAGLLLIPGVCEPPDVSDTVLEAQFRTVQELTAQAVDRLVEMRRAEGAALLKDLHARCAEIRSRLAEIQTRAPIVVEDYAKRLRGRVQQLLAASSVELEEDTLAREVAIFAERCDLNEEIARTGSHLDQFLALCDAPVETGRKLEFLSQELLREANTIGSKANDAEIARHVVEIKAAIDRIKEQVQNVE
jgi:uncharacterized protein (TIGR00255 family)